MDNLHQNTIFKFSFDDTTKQKLKALAVMAKINAILAFISIGMSVLSIVVSIITLSNAFGMGSGFNAGSSFFGSYHLY